MVYTKNLHMYLFLLTIFGHIYHGPPVLPYTLYWYDAVKVWTFPATDGLGMSWGSQNRPGPSRSNKVEKLSHWAMRNTRSLTVY